MARRKTTQRQSSNSYWLTLWSIVAASALAGCCGTVCRTGRGRTVCRPAQTGFCETQWSSLGSPQQVLYPELTETQAANKPLLPRNATAVTQRTDPSLSPPMREASSGTRRLNDSSAVQNATYTRPMIEPFSQSEPTRGGRIGSAESDAGRATFDYFAP